MVHLFQRPSLNRLNLVLLLALGLCGSTWAAEVDEDTVRQRVIAHATEAVQRVTDANLQKDEIRVEIVQIPRISREFDGVEDPSEIELTTTSTMDRFYSSRGVVQVRMSTADGQIRQMGVPVKIQVKKPVWIVQKHVQAGQPLSAQSIKLELRDVSNMLQTSVGPEKEARKLEARVNLQPGEILDIRKIQTTPAVRRNADVRIILSDGHGMTISLQGQALSDAQMGEYVKVKRYRSGSVTQPKYYSAKVIAKNQVLVEI
jgi:flagella basal body P-ring formation protein FlgA